MSIIVHVSAVRSHLEALEAEVAQLQAALAAAETRAAELEDVAAGPFFATIDGPDLVADGRRLPAVLDELCGELMDYLQRIYEKHEWLDVVPRWEIVVDHGVEYGADLDPETGEAQVVMASSAGCWRYGLRLGLGSKGELRLVAERKPPRAPADGGAR